MSKYKVLNDQVLEWLEEIKSDDWNDDEYDSILQEMDDYFEIGKEKGLGDVIDSIFADATIARMMYMAFVGGYDYGRVYMMEHIDSEIAADELIDKLTNEQANQA